MTTPPPSGASAKLNSEAGEEEEEEGRERIEESELGWRGVGGVRGGGCEEGGGESK